MAFASTNDNDGIPNTVGDKKIVTGTFTNGVADTGGEVATGLRRLLHVSVQHTGAAVAANAPAVNETFPFEGGTFTLVSDADADGIWMAYGE